MAKNNLTTTSNFQSIFSKHFLNLKPSCSSKEDSKVKKWFNEVSFDQMKEYISLLESNLILNKQLVLELCDNSTEKATKLIANLTNENSKIQDQFRKTQTELEKIQCKYLCLLQQYEEQKQTDNEAANSLRDRIDELNDQLNRKEYIIQYIESRFFKAENTIKRIQKKYPDIKILGDYEYKNNEFRITNIIDENEKLNEENKSLTNKIHELELQIKASNFNSTFSSSRGKVYSPLSAIDLNKYCIKKENYENYDKREKGEKRDTDNVSEYRTKIKELEEENKERITEFDKLRMINLNLIKLNLRQTTVIKSAQSLFEKIFTSELELNGMKCGFLDKIMKKYVTNLQILCQNSASCDYNLEILINENREINENYQNLDEKFIRKNFTNYFDKLENISVICKDQDPLDSFEFPEFEQ